MDSFFVKRLPIIRRLFLFLEVAGVSMAQRLSFVRLPTKKNKESYRLLRMIQTNKREYLCHAVKTK
jgi:hypothetical protein